MTDNEIFEKLKAIVYDIKDEMPLSMDTALIESGIMDSLELINYLTQIEETFGLNISMDVLIEQKLGKIENLIKFIQEKA